MHKSSRACGVRFECTGIATRVAGLRAQPLFVCLFTIVFTVPLINRRLVGFDTVFVRTTVVLNVTPTCSLARHAIRKPAEVFRIARVSRWSPLRPPRYTCRTRVRVPWPKPSVTALEVAVGREMCFRILTPGEVYVK
jgi:hypothetical protein